MGLPQKSLAYITPEEYRALEAVAKEKHDHLDGRICAWQGEGPNGMVGGAPIADNRVSVNFPAALRGQGAGSDREAMMSDVRVAPQGSNPCCCPDVMVRCGPPLPGHTSEVEDACLVVEVLSDSTEGFDRTEEFDACRSMPTRETFVLVSLGRRTIEAFERSGGWTRRVVAERAALCGGRMTLSHATVFSGR